MDARLVAQPQSDDPSADEESPDTGDRGPTTGPLARIFLSGTLLTAAGRYGNYLVQVVTTAVLARLLAPGEFGIIAMVTVYTGFATILADSGINAAVIQRRTLDHRELSTTFWFSASIGIGLVILTLLVAPVVESVYGLPGLAPVLRVMSVNLLLVSLTSVPKGRLSRDLRFGKLAAIEFASALISGALAVVAALAGAGYWALVAQQTTMLAIRLVLVMFSARFLPQMVFDRDALASVVSFSAYVLGFSVINYWARNADNLLIGRVLGPQELGYYSQAYGLMVVPQLLLTGILQTVIHPVFSAFQHDSSRSRLAYRRLIELLMPVSALLATYMYFMAPEIIRVVLGPSWERSVAVLRWLAAASALQPVAALSGPVLLARNREKWYFGIGVVSTLIFVAGFLISVRHGIIAVATSYVVTNLVVAPAVVIISYKLACGGRAQDLARPALSALAISSILGLVLARGRTLFGGVEPVLALAIAAIPLALLVLPGVTAQVRHWSKEESGW